MIKISVINGPNLNLLGIREPNIYGSDTYEELVRLIDETCAGEGMEVTIFQSNHEGDLVDQIQKAYGQMDGIVINPAAYTHTSIAILDALKAVALPTVEVHLSDIASRETFRKHSYTSLAASHTICGRGIAGYAEAIVWLKQHLLSA